MANTSPTTFHQLELAVTAVKGKFDSLEDIYATKAEVGSPLVAALKADMTDHDKIYVYTGSESGMTSGHWYYWNGSAWADGGVYNSTAFITDETLTLSGQAADSKVVGDKFDVVDETLEDLEERKVDYNATADDLTSGQTKQLLSTTYVEDSEPYIFRTSGGSADIGNIEQGAIVGGSVPWNQLVQNGDFAIKSIWSVSSGMSYTVANNIASIVYPEISGSAVRRIGQYVNLVEDHKYLITFDINSEIAYSQYFSYAGSNGSALSSKNFALPANEWVQVSRIEAAKVSGSNIFLIGRNGAISSEYILKLKNVNIIDLTLLFGTTIADYIYNLEQANAGAGVAWVRRYFPNDFYSYNPGSMESVQVSAHKMVGFNAYNPTTGTARVLGGMAYQITGAYTALAIDGAEITPDADGIFTPSENSTLTVTGGDSTTTCVHLVWSGYRNGEYEEYIEHTYSLDDTLTLRGIPRLDANDKLYFDGDVYKADGTVTRRYGIVDLGTLNWVRTSGGVDDGYIFYALYNTAALPMRCTKYSYAGSAAGNSGAFNKGDKTLSRISSGTRIYIRDDAYTDVATFLAAMQGVMLVYGSPEPTTETALPFAENQTVDDFGTEEYVDYAYEQGLRDVKIPVGHETKYLANLRDKVQHLPSPANGDGLYMIRQEGSQMTLTDTTAITANFADGFDPAKTYETGDPVMYNMNLYLRRQGAASAGEWNPANWARVTVGEYLKLITMLYADTGDWNVIDKIVKSGIAKAVLPVGRQIEDTWSESEDSTVYTVPWDIVHHYDNGDMAIKWHYTTPTGVPFDEPEAVFYAPAGGLAAGQYYIVIGSAYGNGWVVGDKINFTLNSAMDEGDQFVIATATNSDTNPTNARTWRVYAKGSTVVKDTGTTSNSSVGTNLGTIAPESASKTNGIFNSPPRIVYGYNRWSQSAWRQWANSLAPAGEWWEPQNPWDRPPAVAATLRGLLAGFSADFLAVLQPVAVTTALNTVEGLEDATETTYDKIFLPSMTQMYATEQYAEDEPWEYYQTLAAQAGVTGRFKTGSSNVYEVLKNYSIADTTSAVNARLRSAARGNASYTWYVNSTGYFTSATASTAFRGCPACILKKSST